MKDNWFDGKCSVCGEVTRVPFDPARSRSPVYCRKHLSMRASGGSGTSFGGRPTLPPDYLESGYFDDSGSLWPALVTQNAEQVAKTLAQAGVTNTLLYRFFATVKNIEQQMGTDLAAFDSVRCSILALQPMVASVVGRAKGRSTMEGERLEVFKDFIDRNVVLAVTAPEFFTKGFLKHFEYVVAYFKYFSPRK